MYVMFCSRSHSLCWLAFQSAAYSKYMPLIALCFNFLNLFLQLVSDKCRPGGMGPFIPWSKRVRPCQVGHSCPGHIALFRAHNHFFIPGFCRQAGHGQRGYSETAQEPDCLQPGCPGFAYTWTRNRRRYSDSQNMRLAYKFWSQVVCQALLTRLRA